MENPQTETIQETQPTLWRQFFPTNALALLLAIGFVDLVATAVLHSRGLIVELNPIMRPLIERSEWLFAAVKGLTLLLAWSVMHNYAKHNVRFVRKAAFLASSAYLFIWTTWFIGGSVFR